MSVTLFRDRICADVIELKWSQNSPVNSLRPGIHCEFTGEFYQAYNKDITEIFLKKNKMKSSWFRVGLI